MIAAIFILLVIAGSHTYERGRFHSYDSCVVAGQAEIDSQRWVEDIRWQCLPTTDNR